MRACGCLTRTQRKKRRRLERVEGRACRKIQSNQTSDHERHGEHSRAPGHGRPSSPSIGRSLTPHQDPMNAARNHTQP